MAYLTPEQINSSFPIVGFIGYSGGIIVKRVSNCDLIQANYSHIRGKITMVQRRSINRLALLVKSCGVTFQSVMTVTYGQNYPMSGKLAKKHLNAFLVASKRAFGKFEYVWICEFQERGAVHFHFATTLNPPTHEQREEFARIWQRISTPMSWMYCQLDVVNDKFVAGQTLLTDQACLDVHMHPKHWESLRKRDGVGRYFAKYAAKIYQKKVPDWYHDVGRFWGASRGVKMPDEEHYQGNDDQIRTMLAFAGRDVKNWRVLPKIILL